MMNGRYAIAGLVALAVALTSNDAGAQPSAADKAAADALFRDGKELLDAGNVAAACAKLAESQRIDPRLGTLLNLAACHEREGKTASAWAEFNEAAAQASNARQTEREEFARGKVAAIDKKLSRLQIVLGEAAPGTEVKVDGSPLRAAALGTAIPLDPGAHTIEATAPGRKPWRRSVTIAQGPHEETLDVPPLEPLDAPAPATPSEPEPARSSPTVWKAAGLGLFAVGSAAIGAGAFYGLRTLEQRDDAEAQCVGERCTQAGLDTYDEARTAATVSTIALGVGTVMVLAGAYLALFPPGEKGATAWRVGPGMVATRW